MYVQSMYMKCITNLILDLALLLNTVVLVVKKTYVLFLAEINSKPLTISN
jgi:hypothetical protein